jgi:hypothetical protein
VLWRLLPGRAQVRRWNELWKERGRVLMLVRWWGKVAMMRSGVKKTMMMAMVICIATTIDL